MLLPSEIFVYLEVFLNPEILYSKSHKQYFYNRHLIHNFTEEYFNEEVAKILKNINFQLRSGKKNEKFLKMLLNITSQNIELFKKIYHTNLNDFKNLKHDEIPLEITQSLHLSDEPFSRNDIQNTTDKYITTLKKRVENKNKDLGSEFTYLVE